MIKKITNYRFQNSKLENSKTHWKVETGKWKLSRGVTIVELIIYIGLLSVFIMVLLDVFITILNARLETESTSALNQDTRYILSKLSYDVANSDSVNIPVNLGDSGSTLRFTKNGTVYTYTLDASGNLILNDSATQMKLNGNDTTITNITFTKIGNTEVGSKPTVKITYTIKSLIHRTAGQEEQTINTTLGLR